jgi:phosphoribosylglycinamide formyltransferase-1
MFLQRFGGRTINTHPALLPAFPGPHAVKDTLDHGVKVTGATVILIDAGIDTGPIVAQAPVEVRPDDDEARLHERIKEVERLLLVDTVRRLVTDGWTVNGRMVSVP